MVEAEDIAGQHLLKLKIFYDKIITIQLYQQPQSTIFLNFSTQNRCRHLPWLHSSSFNLRCFHILRPYEAGYMLYFMFILRKL
ncbi:hypothetical protein BDZ91DRAFT_714189 [Kalaharituber pfeilii]|nr:hypothetical protein BDZ91DRAFT_714189 [Kalaharituber pfeilii]